MVGPHRQSRLDRLYTQFKKSLPESQKIREERRIRREQNKQQTIKIPTWFGRLYIQFKKSLPESQKIREERRIRREQNNQQTIKIPTWFEREYVNHFFEIKKFHNIPGISIKYTNTFENDKKFFTKLNTNLQIKITKQLEKFNNIKVMISCIALFQTSSGDVREVYHRLKTFNVSKRTKVSLSQHFDYMKEMLLELEEGESGLIYQYIKEINVEIVKNSKIRGANYIPTPTSIEGKKAILNIQNKDNFCFLYCIAAADNPIAHGKHAYRPSNYNIGNYNTGLQPRYRQGFLN